MSIGRGRPKNAINHKTAPNEKNQNSSPAQSLCVTVARAKTVKNVWVSTAQRGRKKMAMTNFTQRVGIIHRSEEKCRRAVGIAADAVFPRRAPLRPWCNIVLRFFAAKVIRRIRRLG